MTYNPYRRNEALWYAFLLWIFGFVWGVIVFMVPALKNLPSLPSISKYPAISFPLLVFYTIVLYILSKDFLKETGDRAGEGIKFGATIFFLNFILDVLVYYFLFAGGDYFAYLSIWISYAFFVVEPWWVGKKSERGDGA